MVKLWESSLKLCMGDHASQRGMTDLRQAVCSTSHERVERKRNLPSCSDIKERKRAWRKIPGR